jgi:MFS family permease
LIPSILLFSLMSGLSGMVHGLTTLILIRALMGAMEGTYCPTSFTAVAAASKPARRGFNQGLQQSGFALFGLALGPIIATQLLNVVPSWRWVFWIVAIPGFIVGVLLFMQLREPRDTQAGALIGATQPGGSWVEVLKAPNIVVCMLALLCAMSCVFVLSAMVPVYLVNVLQLTPGQMGVVTSAIGFGGFFGQFGWPGLSDKFGRKPLAILGFIGATLTVWWFASTGAAVLPLFVALFVCSFFCLGNVALITGPIATESAPRGLISSYRYRGGCRGDLRRWRRALYSGRHRRPLRVAERVECGVDGRRSRYRRLPISARDGTEEDGRREPSLRRVAPGRDAPASPRLAIAARAGARPPFYAQRARGTVARARRRRSPAPVTDTSLVAA